MTSHFVLCHCTVHGPELLCLKSVTESGRNNCCLNQLFAGRTSRVPDRSSGWEPRMANPCRSAVGARARRLARARDGARAGVGPLLLQRPAGLGRLPPSSRPRFLRLPAAPSPPRDPAGGALQTPRALSLPLQQLVAVRHAHTTRQPLPLRWFSASWGASPSGSQ